MYLPGFFISVDLGDAILSNPQNVIDVSNLNFAVVMAEDDAPVQARWTTWGMEADSLYLYQALTDKNRIIAGNNGFLYVLNEEEFTDGGNAIPIILTTAPLPTPDDSVSAYTMKRVHSIIWEIHTPPPIAGYEITVTLTDVDDESNTVSRTVTQYGTRMEIDLALRARQFRLTLSASVTTDFDLILLACKFQVMDQRKSTTLT